MFTFRKNKKGFTLAEVLLTLGIIGVISALTGKDDVVFSDKLNHASIIDGMLLSKGDFFRNKEQCSFSSDVGIK